MSRAGPGQLGAFDGVDSGFERPDPVDRRYERGERSERPERRREQDEPPGRRYERGELSEPPERRDERGEPPERRYERNQPPERRYERNQPSGRRYERAAADLRYAGDESDERQFDRVERSGRRLNGANQPDEWESSDGWDEPREPRETRHERPRPTTRGGNGAPPSSDRDRYSGYPTAARLLGIGSSVAYLPGGDEMAEPGKWQRSERLQSWLEDAEQGAQTGRVETVERDEWSESFAQVDPDLEQDAPDVARPGELQAGVLPYRASQARRAPMPQPQRIGRQAARRGMPWERRARPETFPPLRPQQEARGRRISPVLLATLALLLAAGVVFALPNFLAGRPPQAAAPPTSAPTATVAPTAAPTTVAAPTPRIYTVAKGDTIRGIASQFKLTMDELLGANPEVTNPSRIRIGQKLVIPSPASAQTSSASP